MVKADDAGTDQSGGSETSDLIAQLRDEFATQINDLKISTKQAIEERDAEITRLTTENADLKRSLIRDAITNPDPKPVEKSAEDIYKENIDKLAAKTIAYMKA